MIPIPMKAAGWFRTYGKKKNSACRVYECLGSLENPDPYPKRWCISTYHLIGERTSMRANQLFCKGTSNYDFKLAELREAGIIE